MRGKASKLVFAAIDGACNFAGFTLYYCWLKPKHMIEQAKVHRRFHKEGTPHILSDPSGPFPQYVKDISKPLYNSKNN